MDSRKITSPAQEKQVEASVEDEGLTFKGVACGVLVRASAGHEIFLSHKTIAALATASPSEDAKRLLREALLDAQNQIIGFCRERNPKVSNALKLLAAMSSPSVTQTETETSATPPTLGAQWQQDQETDGVPNT